MVERRPGKLVACFDMEGPLTPVDFAQSLFIDVLPGGERLYDLLSRYDDILALELHRERYEPGDTLALVLPFLVAHGLDVDRIGKHATRPPVLTPGATETLRWCRETFAAVSVITTAYDAFATAVARELDQPLSALYCTILPGSFDALVPNSVIEDVLRLERRFLAEFADGDLNDPAFSSRLVAALDQLYMEQFPSLGIPYPIEVLQPRGGTRKVDALTAFLSEVGAAADTVAYVGDSITDVAIFEHVATAGGLAVAFNGNSYAIGVADVAVASRTLLDVVSVLSAWQSGGHQAVSALVASRQATEPKPVDTAWLKGTTNATREAVALRHAKFRKELRGAAADLG